MNRRHTVTPPRRCKSCGAPEKRFRFGYTNFALGGYCAKCINSAAEQKGPDRSLSDIDRELEQFP